MKIVKDKYVRKARLACLGLMVGFVSLASAKAQALDIRHLVNEQNIISIENPKRYLLLPVQESAPEARVVLISDNRSVRPGFTVRLARERVDYFVPVDLSAYVGKRISIDVQGVPGVAMCWEKIKLSETFDTTNREVFRPLYHHTPAYGWMNDPNGMFYKDGVLMALLGEI